MRMAGQGLKDALRRFWEAFNGEESQRRVRLWQAHRERKAKEVIPVYFSVPFDWSPIRLKLWMELLDFPLDLERIMSAVGEYPRDLAEKLVEFQLRQRTFYIEKMPGDMPVSPKISTNFNMLWLKNLNGQNAIWDNVSYDLESCDFHMEPFLEGEGGLDSLRLRPFRFDEALHRRRVSLFRELAGEGIEIQDDNLGFGFLNRVGSPFEEACRVRGMMNILMDMRDNPDFLRRLMAKLAKMGIERAAEMNRASGLDCFQPAVGGDDVNCQMFSPEDYKEFIHPCEMEVSACGRDLYYHSCGCLTPIYGEIAKLRNLDKVHVSPWSDLAAAAEAFQGSRTIVQRLMDTRRDIMERDAHGMCAQARRMKEAIGGSFAEIGCHCETADVFMKSKEFVCAAREAVNGQGHF